MRPYALRALAAALVLEVSVQFGRALVIVILAFAPVVVGQQSGQSLPRTQPAQPVQSVRPTRADVLKLFQAMHVRNMMESVRAMAIEQAHATLKDMIDGELPGATREQVAELQGMVDKTIASYTINNTIEDLIPIYQKHLSKSDVVTATAFFSSPTGQRILESEPVISKEALQVVNSRTGKQMAATMQQVEKRLDEMKSAKEP